MGRRRRRLSLLTFSPVQVGGLVAWYDSSDTTTIDDPSSSIESQDDKSGNENTLTQSNATNRPLSGSNTLNTKNVTTFDGVNDALSASADASIANIFDGGGTVFVAFRPESDGGSNFGRVFEKPSGSILLLSDEFANGVSARFFQNFTGGNAFWVLDNNDISIDSGNLVSISYDSASASNDPSFRVNGSPAESSESGTPSGTATDDSGQVLYVGNRVALDRAYDGDIAEILFYDRALTANETSAVESYLSNKWALPNSNNYDVIALMGQSNMIGRYGPIDSTLDATDTSIRQWGREGVYDDNVILAFDPLQHDGATADTVGLGLTFAKAHHAATGRKVLLVPCAKGATGFSNNNWNVGDTLYEDAVARVNAAIGAGSGNVLTHVLWHQGEADSSLTESAYATALDDMVNDFRSRVTGASNIPFVCGGISTASTLYSADVDAALADTPDRLSNAFYTDVTGLALGADSLHFTATSERALGQRYYDEVTGA